MSIEKRSMSREEINVGSASIVRMSEKIAEASGKNLFTFLMMNFGTAQRIHVANLDIGNEYDNDDNNIQSILYENFSSFSKRTSFVYLLEIVSQINNVLNVTNFS